MVQATTYSQILEIKRRITTIDRFLAMYSWLINSYTTDYFTLGLEDKFPKAFSRYLLKEGTLSDLASLLPNWQSSSESNETFLPERSSRVMPLSMLSFQSLCLGLSLGQDISLEEVETKPAAEKSESQPAADNFVSKPTADKFVFGTSLEKYFRVCVKAKKRHEVDILAELLSSLCKANGCEHVVDIGAGVGHLSRLLTFSKRMKVTTIEATDSHSPKAQRLDKRTDALMKKQKVDNSDTSTQPNHVSHYIQSSISTEQFVSLLRESDTTQPSPTAAEQPSPTAADKLSLLSDKMSSLISQPSAAPSQGRNSHIELSRFDLPWKVEVPDVDASLYLTSGRVRPHPQYSSLSNPHSCYSSASSAHAQSNSAEEERVCLSGLHTCGDLASTMIRVFVNLPCAKVLSSVGCCYMKLSAHCTDNMSDDNPSGFPMSNFVMSLDNYSNLCAYESLELGCHSLTQYRQRLLDEEDSLRRHVIRSALQILIYRRRRKDEIQFKRLKIKNSEQISFKEYTERAFKRLDIEYDVTEAEIAECEQIIESHWRAVVGAYTVRLALAPLVEAYILLDRMLYLWEHGIGSQLIPLFDPLISPRNMALLAVKTDQ